MPDYSKLTDEEFDACLEKIVGMLTPAQILALPRVYEALAEDLNDEVLDAWAADQPEERCSDESGGELDEEKGVGALGAAALDLLPFKKAQEDW